MKTILFYSSVDDMSLFDTQKFYVNTVDVLKQIGYNVVLTNNIMDAWTRDYDAIFSFFYRKSVLPSYIAKIRGKKVFFTGGIDAMEKSLVSTKTYLIQVVLFKLSRLIADWCLIESKSDIANINKISLIKDHRNLCYSPQAIELSRYSCSFLNKSNDFATICWMGAESNLKRKGVDISLYYFKVLLQFPEFKNSKYYIMGRKGKGTPYVETLVKKLELTDNVIITGEVSEDYKIDKLKRCRYYFQLSQYEGFGLAALEAVAADCIAIHSGRGGLADVICKDGVLVDITKFDYSIDTVETDIYERIMSITVEDINKMHERVYFTFDNTCRVNNFKSTVGAVLK